MTSGQWKKYRIQATIAVIAIIAGGGWWIYNRCFSERANPSLVEYPVRGIDISAHNGPIDFDALAGADIDFAYIKATEGTDFIDRSFVRNARELRRKEIPAGAYHFFRFDSDGEMQAWNFMRALRGREFQLPPAIDLEEWTNPDDLSTRQIISELHRMLTLLKAEGFNPIIYTNKNGYQRFVKTHLSDYPLWICSFSDPPLPGNAEWDIWQFSHRGSIPGIDGMVDLNTINPNTQLFKMPIDTIKL